MVSHGGHAKAGRRLGARLAQCCGAICVPKLGRPQREREVSFLVCQHFVHPRSVGSVPTIWFVLDVVAKHLAKQYAGNMRDQASLGPVALHDAHLRKGCSGLCLGKRAEGFGGCAHMRDAGAPSGERPERRTRVFCFASIPRRLYIPRARSLPQVRAGRVERASLRGRACSRRRQPPARRGARGKGRGRGPGAVAW